MAEGTLAPRTDPSSRTAATPAATLIAVAAVAIVIGLFCSTYARADRLTPVGSDTLQDVWRARVVAAGGLDALPTSGPNAVNGSVDRPGLPLLMALLHGIDGTGVETIAFGLPAAAGAALALAAGAFGVGVLGRPGWTLGLFALVVGTSVQTEFLSAGYFDNLCAAVVLMGAFALLFRGSDIGDEGWRTWAGGLGLLTAGALFHWQFALYSAGLLLAVAVWTWLRPGVRRAAHALSPSAMRIGTAAGAGAVLSVALLALDPVRLLGPAIPVRRVIIAKLSRLYPLPVVPVVIALAVAGVLFLRGVRGSRLQGRRFLVAWGTSAGLAVLLLAGGSNLPAHRAVAFAFAVPILATLAIERLLSPSRAGERLALKTAGRVAGVLLLIGGVVLTGSSWLARRSPIDAGSLAALNRVASTVDAIPTTRPVVVVVDAPEQADFGIATAVRRIRALIDPAHVPQVRFFLGDAADALAARPTERPSDPTFTALADKLWPAVGPVLRRDPVIVVAGRYDHSLGAIEAAHPGAARAPGLVVFRGSVGPRPAISRGPGLRTALAMALFVFLVIALVGLGWAFSVGPDPLGLRLALAPALGTGALALGAFGADRWGALVGSRADAWAVVAGVGIAGWLPWTVRRIAARRSGPSDA